uniref:pirin-like C-terminal cupin domain-containing protein n=1 Tax=Algoriphagus halophilus TaxID=226505 RepID=UPI00403790B5
MVRGELKVNGQSVPFRNLVEFESGEVDLEVTASSDAILILGHAQPFNEPMVAQGPFVMNTEEEIHQAYEDYRIGKFGTWNH